MSSTENHNNKFIHINKNNFNAESMTYHLN